jgi:hypothetical protein
VPTFRDIASDAMMEIGALGQGETMSAPDAQLCLRYGQRMIDAWAADRLTLSVQSQLSIPWPSSTSTQTIGPTGDIVAQRPVWINQMNYVIPGSSPAVETPMAPMNDDQYAQNTIKLLQSALPQQFYYQTSIDTTYGTLYIWPEPTQDVTLMLYAPQAVGVPVSLDSILGGPPGYLEAYHYQLSLRLMVPFSRKPQDCPLLVGPGGLAAVSFANMKRQNVDPGLLGCDPALIPRGGSGGYNILSDSISAPSAH